jgi:molybdopterin-guanine dinucleotide biosynthesis protein A
VNAYILTGGRSRRMGVSKTDLFLDRVVAAARPVFDDVFAVQRADGGTLSIPTIFEEPHADGGAIFGVAAALRHAREKCFLLAVDYPFLTADVLQFLRDREGIPVWNGKPQPLCAVWDARVLPLIEERIAARAYHLRDVSEREMIAEAELRARFAGEALLNVNTPEEWERGQGFLASR